MGADVGELLEDGSTEWGQRLWAARPRLPPKSARAADGGNRGLKKFGFSEFRCCIAVAILLHVSHKEVGELRSLI
jgi:hypothetical protein